MKPLLSLQKNITLFAICFSFLTTFAQVPQKMSYQTVIRNGSNALINNAAVGIKISVLQATSTGSVVYAETQTPTTNANGLASLEIGAGTPVTGAFNTIDWAAGPYFIKTETDPSGSTNYSIASTSQLLSVPYALASADNKWASNASGIHTNNNFVGIGTNVPTNSYTGLALKSNANTWYGSYIDAGANGLPFYGYAINGVPKAYTQYNSANNNFEIVNGSASVIFNNNGFLGIGVSSPATRLDVLGNNNWDLSNTQGDARIGNSTYNLKIGVALGGGGAGTCNIASTGMLSLGTGTANLNILNVSGDKVGVGTIYPTAKLQVVGIIEYADNAAAVAAGLTAGAFYRTGDVLKIVH